MRRKRIESGAQVVEQLLKPMEANMKFISEMFWHHPVVAVFAILAILTCGIFCFRGGASTRIKMTASSRGIVVGGDNHGLISTGQTEGSRTVRPIEVIGAILMVLAVAVAVIAWLYPKVPS